MTRKPLIAGNWKMNLDHLEAIQLVQQLTYHLEPEDYRASEIVVIPPFTALRSIQTLIDGDRLSIGLGAQNCYFEASGAYTGEISPGMLAKLRVEYVLCGHSERRTVFGEDDETVAKKVGATLSSGMTPILCVGETLEQRESQEAEEVVFRQLTVALDGLGSEQVAGLVIAYEPVWAIGTGRTATAGDANAMCAFVRTTVGERFGDGAAGSVRIQYGGSVKPGNIAELMRQSDIDGALVGGASVDAEDFAVVCRYHRL